jgi:hypothetical protein
MSLNLTDTASFVRSSWTSLRPHLIENNRRRIRVASGEKLKNSGQRARGCRRKEALTDWDA